ncbi:hypothetical protein [Leclercia sp. LSNIH3]|uniref:hypothetical protein n=1 Tax=Leclercia sp. LSNIH3 TaxID=1920116 RepID=UPI003FA3C99C
MPQWLTLERVELAVADDAPLAGMRIQRGRPLLGLDYIAVDLSEFLPRRGGHVIHRGAGHHRQVTPGSIDHPIFPVKFWRAGNAPDNLFYRLALEEAGAHSIGDFVQPVGFKLLAPLLQQSPLEWLRCCCGVDLLGSNALQRNVFQDLLWDAAAEQVQLIPGLIFNVARQFACQRRVNRFVGLLIQFTHTSQQRCQATGAVGIRPFAVQKHQQFRGQLGIQFIQQRHHAPGDASAVARHIEAMRYRLILQAVVDGTGHITPLLLAVRSARPIQPATHQGLSQGRHQHQSG